MAFTENWVEGDPDGSIITVSQLDNWVRKTKVAVRERMEASLVKAGTWAAAPEPYFVPPNANGAIFRTVGNTANVAVVNDFGITLSAGKRLYAADNTAVNKEILFYNTFEDTISIGSISDRMIQVSALLTAQIPAGAVGKQGCICIDRSTADLVYFSGGNRYHVTGVAF